MTLLTIHLLLAGGAFDPQGAINQGNTLLQGIIVLAVAGLAIWFGLARKSLMGVIMVLVIGALIWAAAYLGLVSAVGQWFYNTFTS